MLKLLGFSIWEHAISFTWSNTLEFHPIDCRKPSICHQIFLGMSRMINSSTNILWTSLPPQLGICLLCTSQPSAVSIALSQDKVFSTWAKYFPGYNGIPSSNRNNDSRFSVSICLLSWNWPSWKYTNGL